MGIYDDMKLSKKLAMLRVRRGIGSQADLAKQMEVHPSLVSQWENGKSVPKLADAHRLAVLYDVSLDYLANDEMDESPTPHHTSDESVLLRVFRSSGLSVDEAIGLFTRRSIQAPAAGHVVPSTNPETGEPLHPQQGRKSTA